MTSLKLRLQDWFIAVNVYLFKVHMDVEKRVDQGESMDWPNVHVYDVQAQANPDYLI